ncbi:MAG: NirD/YgiW/YdeI family stress tolerance protein [Oculatellaceae cyanobacterium Prado106]|jgi:uncharacterized protein YdeI (BOF family)|nr:NirD/YgiW/YdeI family stress tolerance protein [Oculatellaceae cyanobacterium Prado106]
MKFGVLTTLTLTATAAIASVAAIHTIAQANAMPAANAPRVATPVSMAQGASPSAIGDLQRMNTVTIAGEVVQIQGDEFILRDGTGEMFVEAESRAIRQANLRTGDRITVVGHFDDDNSFETVSITPSNGSVIYVFDD